LGLRYRHKCYAQRTVTEATGHLPKRYAAARYQALCGGALSACRNSAELLGADQVGKAGASPEYQLAQWAPRQNGRSGSRTQPPPIFAASATGQAAMRRRT